MFLRVHKKIFPILLLVFVAVTLFTYYSGSYDYRGFMQFSNTSNVKLNENAQSNKRIYSSKLLSGKNTTMESSPISISISNTTLGKGNVSTDPTSLSTSLRPQSSSSASKAIGSKSTDKIILNKNIKNNNTSKSEIADLPIVTVSTSVVNKNSVVAIYPRGHSISVPEKCPNNGKELDLVIVIMSAPSHFEARMGIRQTWGHYSLRSDISIVFILGTTNDAKLERELKQEVKYYSDIIRGNFVDSYSNLTLKTISTLEWVNVHCSEAKFLLKTDDDMFINVPKLLSFTIKHKRNVNVIYGRVAKKWKPYRSKHSKYYVPLAQFNGSIFPDFTTGPAYLLSKDVIGRLYNTSMNETYMNLEDVFITGIVAAKLGIKRVHAGEFLNTKISYQPCSIKHGISIHMVKASEQFELWAKLLDGKTKCKG